MKTSFQQDSIQNQVYCNRTAKKNEGTELSSFHLHIKKSESPYCVAEYLNVRNTQLTSVSLVSFSMLLDLTELRTSSTLFRICCGLGGSSASDSTVDSSSLLPLLRFLKNIGCFLRRCCFKLDVFPEVLIIFLRTVELPEHKSQLASL